MVRDSRIRENPLTLGISHPTPIRPGGTIKQQQQPSTRSVYIPRPFGRVGTKNQGQEHAHMDNCDRFTNNVYYFSILRLGLERQINWLILTYYKLKVLFGNSLSILSLYRILLSYNLFFRHYLK
jgi:hypothetical protein